MILIFHVPPLAREYKMRAPEALVLLTWNPFSLEKSEIYQKLEVLAR